MEQGQRKGKPSAQILIASEKERLPIAHRSRTRSLKSSRTTRYESEPNTKGLGLKCGRNFRKGMQSPGQAPESFRMGGSRNLVVAFQFQPELPKLFGIQSRKSERGNLGRENDRANGSLTIDPSMVSINDRRQVPIKLKEEGKFRETAASNAAGRRGIWPAKSEGPRCSFSTSQS